MEFGYFGYPLIFNSLKTKCYKLVATSTRGWKELKTMERYVRQAGIDIKGITKCLNSVHNPNFSGGKVLGINSQQKITPNKDDSQGALRVIL